MNNDDPRYNKVMICGPFGVGKSLLLMQKAIQLNEKPKYRGKVLFLVVHQGYAPLKSMLFQRLKVDLQENRGVFVGQITAKFSVSIQTLLGKKLCRDFDPLLRENQFLILMTNFVSLTR